MHASKENARKARNELWVAAETMNPECPVCNSELEQTQEGPLPN